MMMVLTIYQFSLKSSAGPKIIAAIAFIIFFVGIFATRTILLGTRSTRLRKDHDPETSPLDLIQSREHAKEEIQPPHNHGIDGLGEREIRRR
jgi:hypothetical protein